MFWYWLYTGGSGWAKIDLWRQWKNLDICRTYQYPDLTTQHSVLFASKQKGRERKRSGSGWEHSTVKRESQRSVPHDSPCLKKNSFMIGAITSVKLWWFCLAWDRNKPYVDADYAGDGSNRRSRTGFFVFLNEAPICWHSKKQTRIENSVFGSEFIAMRTGLETVQGIRYKLRMMGVPLETPTYIYGDNMSVIYNTSKPESTLKRKRPIQCVTTTIISKWSNLKRTFSIEFNLCFLRTFYVNSLVLQLKLLRNTFFSPWPTPQMAAKATLLTLPMPI